MVRPCLDSLVVLSVNDPLLAIFPKLWEVVEGFAVQDLLPTWLVHTHTGTHTHRHTQAHTVRLEEQPDR